MSRASSLGPIRRRCDRRVQHVPCAGRTNPDVIRIESRTASENYATDAPERSKRKGCARELGPAGQPDGTWADGISLACTDSVVRNNTIVDATDGAIVIFAAPGSIIEDNVIRAETRTPLGGINLVDYAVYGGSYTNTRVRGNVIAAAGAVIRIGMGMGWRVWVCLDPASSEDPSIYGASVTNNTLMGDHMQYGFAVDGVRDWTVTGNIDLATHTGTPTLDCNGQLASPPAGFQIHSARAQGTFQPEFTEAFLELALWAVDGPP